jgi:hypothetical protein
MNSQWVKDLRKRMETHEESSPEGLWDDIEQILRKEKDRAIVPPVLFRKGRIMQLSKQIGAVAAIALVVFFIGYYSLNKNHGNNLSVAPLVQQKGQVKSEIKSIASEKHHVNNNLISLHNNLVASQKESWEVGQTDEYLSLVKTADSTISTGKNKQLEKIIIKPSLNASECKRHFKNVPKKKYDYMYAYSSMSNQDLNSNKKCKVSTFASNLPAAIQNKYNGARDFSATNIDTEGLTGMTFLGEDPFTDILIYNKYVETQTSIKHKQPITGGLTVNYSLNRQWSLVTGVTYTLLSSQLRSGSDHYYYTSEQTLHYLGIPLSICYNVWGNKKTSVYFAIGGAIEKSISGKLTTDYFIDDEIKSGKKEKISIDQLQCSLNASAGIQHNISKRICIYSEPGISYYFKNSSKIETIFKQRPVNLSLHFGISYLW